MTLAVEAAALAAAIASPAASELEISLEVNGRTHRLRVEARSLLSDVLRHDLHLTGTHVGCEQGVCGACTVVCDGVLVRSCLMFAAQADGSAIETIEAVAQGNELHPIQLAFHDEHGLQCGFCTPGMVLATRALLAAVPEPSEEEIREYLSGNICRCTGYSGIVSAVQESARRVAGRGEEP
jgi:aerobic carbon-monoxide dehydrogenase small subunit